jgi:hypothetical protein
VSPNLSNSSNKVEADKWVVGQPQQTVLEEWLDQ